MAMQIGKDIEILILQVMGIAAVADGSGVEMSKGEKGTG